MDVFLKLENKAPEEIVLDLDATDDLIHGMQEGRFFHGYYGNYCYLPLYILGSSWFGVGEFEWAVSRNRLLGIEMKGVVMAEKLVIIPGCKKPDGCRMNIGSPDFVHKRP